MQGAEYDNTYGLLSFQGLDIQYQHSAEIGSAEEYHKNDDYRGISSA